MAKDEPAAKAEDPPPKRIVLFSDGTGNSSAKLFKTNVWRLYDALDVDPVLSGADEAAVRQIAYYDDGVGTSSFRPVAILGGALGIGLARNVRDIYAFLCRNYAPGDKIYGFGFSRGAFTMRVVAGLIAEQGVIRDYDDEADLRRKVAAAYRAFRRSYHLNSPLWLIVEGLRWGRDKAFGLWHGALGHKAYKTVSFKDGDPRLPEGAGYDHPVCPTNAFPDIEFLGLWDTVDAYGLPMDEMTAAWDQYIWPLTMRDYRLHHKVRRARHVLALDDERQTFHPRLWDSDANDNQRLANSDQDGTSPLSVDEMRIAQVWFAGVHSNVGGGYPNDTLSYVSCNWMIERVDETKGRGFGLRFHPEKRKLIRESQDVLGPIYDSRKGFGGYYRYQPRFMEFLKRQESKSLVNAGANALRNRVSNRPAQPGKDVADVQSAPKGEPALKSLAKSLENSIRPGVQLVHHSVLDRIRNIKERVGYAPLTIEQDYRVVGDDASGARIRTPDALGYEKSQQAQNRIALREPVRDLVWVKRILYFLCLFVTARLLLYPFAYHIEKTDGVDPRVRSILSVIPDSLASFLPNLFKPWFDAFASHPQRFVTTCIIVGGLLYLGGTVAGAISNNMALAWRTRSGTAAVQPSWIEKLRKKGWYLAIHRFLKHWFLPAFFALLFYAYLDALLARVIFSTFAEERLCAANAIPDGALKTFSYEGEMKAATSYFDISVPCWSSGIKLSGGRRYEITLETLALPQNDRSLPANLAGQRWLLNGNWRADAFGRSGDQSQLTTFERLKGEFFSVTMLPWRRNFSEPWMTVQMRIDKSGRDVQPLFPKVPPRKEVKDRATLVAEFSARRNGQLFLYVNDMFDLKGCASPYANNRGRMQVTVKMLGWDPNYSKH